MAYILKCSKHGIVCCTKCLYSKAKKKQEERVLDVVEFIERKANDPVRNAQYGE